MELVRLTPGKWVEELSKYLGGEDPGFVQRALLAHVDCSCYGLSHDGSIASFSAIRWQESPRKNAWGRYIDWRFAYTPPALRRKHYATELWHQAKIIARAAGYSRVKSIAKGKLGFYFHRSLGHRFWGWDKGGRGLVVDSAISDEMFPLGVPIEARCAIDAHLMDREELVAAEAALL